MSGVARCLQAVSESLESPAIAALQSRSGIARRPGNRNSLQFSVESPNSGSFMRIEKQSDEVQYAERNFEYIHSVEGGDLTETCVAEKWQKDTVNDTFDTSHEKEKPPESDLPDGLAVGESKQAKHSDDRQENVEIVE